MKRVPLMICLLAVSALVVSSVPVWAQAPSKADYLANIGRNVRLTLTIVDSDPGVRPEERSYEYVGRDDAEASLMMGWRVPIPTTRAGDGEDDAPTTEYVYQNIGFTAKLTINILDDGRILIRGDIETSGARHGPEEMRDAAKDDLPVIGTFQQGIDVTLKEGKPLRLAEVPDPEGGRVHLEIKAEILD
jgi:hypothetical protein